MRIAVLDAGYDRYDHEEHLFTRAGYDFQVFDGPRHDLEGKIAFAAGAAGLLVRWSPVDDAFLARLPGVKAVVRYGVGYDNIDLAAAERHGVRVANVQSYANHAVSDHALALLLGCARLIPLGLSALGKRFGKPPAPDVLECHDRTLGIVGLGRIGGALCRKAQAMYARVLAADPYVKAERFSELGAVACDLSTVLREADAISVHCNLTHETRGLLDEAAFRQMTRRPIVVNTSRGPVLDHAALLAALEDGRVHSAGIDVYPEEPPGENLGPLLDHPRVIATGHYAWYSTRSMVELQRRAAANLLALLRDQEVPDELTPRHSR